MKKRTLPLLTFCLILCMLCSLVLGACTPDNVTPTNTTTPSADGGTTSDTTSGSTSITTSGSTKPSTTTAPEASSNELAFVFDAPKNGTLPNKDTAKVIDGEDGWNITQTQNVIAVGGTNYHFIHAYSKSAFSLGGIPNPQDNSNQYYRLDYANKDNYPTNNLNIAGSLAYKTAGATVRFVTDAPSIAIYATMQKVSVMNHMTNRGAYGFDVYVGSGTNRTWVTCGGDKLLGASGTFQDNISLPSGWKEVMIYFPQYGGVSTMRVGFPSGAKVAKPTDRTGGTIAFYGTSITQGACSSRPGTSYTNILGRTFDADVRNLGFSGSAFGEQVIAQYIAGLSGLNALVMDYDRNHPNNSAGQAALSSAHYPFYKTIRTAQPNLPIIFVTRPVFTTEPTANDLAMRNIVKATYDRAVAEGDTNVYFIDGTTFFPDGAALEDIYTVDGTHPNDTGHFLMASKIYPVLKEAMGK